MIKQDYLVGYEGVCDPVESQNKCFEGCDDDTCAEKYYYLKMVKYAPDLYNECGEDITDCESANLCFPDDRHCSMTYCDPQTDDNCAMEIDIQEDANDEEINVESGGEDITEEDLLQQNN